MKYLKLYLIIASIGCGLDLVSSAKVLFLLPLASTSHKNVFQPLITGMAERGHEVTVVSPYKPSKEVKGIRELVPTNFAVKIKAFGENPFQTRSQGKLNFLLHNNFTTLMLDGCEEAYQNQEFMNLLNEKWDLVYLNMFMNDCIYGFVHKLNVPFIGVTTIAAPNSISSFTGNRLPSSFVPTAMFDFPDSMNFGQRVANFAFNTLFDVLGAVMYNPGNEKMYRKYLGEDTPGIYEVASTVSAIFMNSHFTLTYPRPTLPDVLEVGGMHCRPAKPLPKEIEEFVSGAEHGFIFFSLGSIVQASTMPDNVRQIFLNVFSRLKQRVLWKWETGIMEDLPENVKLLKWAPQQDILGHKNIRMFITHGGLLSTQEATYHGVPLIGLPIFGDQDLNMKKAERAGYALTVEVLEVTEQIFEEAINKILNDQQYTNTAKELSARFRDQPQTPLERAIFWSEYVIRHRGLVKSAARNLNFFQYHSLDVIATMTLITITLVWLLKVIFVGIFRLIFKRGSKNQQTKVKSQ